MNNLNYFQRVLCNKPLDELIQDLFKTRSKGDLNKISAFIMINEKTKGEILEILNEADDEKDTSES